MPLVKCIAAVCFIWSLSLTALAAEIQLGEQRVLLPPADGFVELTPEMSPYYESLSAYKNPENVRFMTLIGEQDALAINRGEVVELGRYLNAESHKSIHNMSVISAQFDALRNEMRTQIDSAYTEAKKSMPAILADGNNSLSEQFDVDVAIKLGGIVPLPAHLDEDEAIAHSILMTVRGSIEGEDALDSVVAATTTVLFVKNKVTFRKYTLWLMKLFQDHHNNQLVSYLHLNREHNYRHHSVLLRMNNYRLNILHR